LQRLNAKIATVNMAPSHGRVTVAAFLTEWLAHKRVHVRASTLRAYEQDVRLHLEPALGVLPLNRLQARDAQRVIDELAKAGKWNMADRVRRTLKTALNAAVKWGYTPVNVMNQVDAVRKPAPRRGVYTLEQVQAFLRAADGSSYYPLFALAFATGMRKGELLALQWRDVSTVGVHVRRTVSINAPGDGTTPPKTNAGFRFIPVQEDVMQLVQARRTPHARDEDWVFTTRNAKRLSGRNVSFAMRRVQQRANLPEIRFHDFRRTYATLLAEAGHHPKVIQALLGHATPNLAMTVYADATDRARDRAYIDLHIGTLSGTLSTARERHATVRPKLVKGGQDVKIQG